MTKRKILMNHLSDLVDFKTLFGTFITAILSIVGLVASNTQPNQLVYRILFGVVIFLGLFFLLSFYIFFKKVVEHSKLEEENLKKVENIKKNIADNKGSERLYSPTLSIIQGEIFEDTFQFIAVFKKENENFKKVAYAFYHHNKAEDFLQEYEKKSHYFISQSLLVQKNLQSVARGTLLRLLFDPIDFGAIVLGNCDFEEHYIVGLTTEQENVNLCSTKMGELIDSIRKIQFGQEPIINKKRIEKS